MMKKGFTLLEMIIVVIIVGILATLAISQYGKMVEKSRGAEARAVISTLRTLAATIYIENSGDCTKCTNGNLGVGSDFPGPAVGDCNSSNYFFYGVTAAAGAPSKGADFLATRCTGAGVGKSPPGIAGDTIKLSSDFTPAGKDDWTYTGAYK